LIVFYSTALEHNLIKDIQNNILIAIIKNKFINFFILKQVS